MLQPTAGSQGPYISPTWQLPIALDVGLIADVNDTQGSQLQRYACSEKKVFPKLQ